MSDVATVEGPQELVATTAEGKTYHRRVHRCRSYVTTWTRQFAEEGLLLRPCRICFPHDVAHPTGVPGTVPER